MNAAPSPAMAARLVRRVRPETERRLLDALKLEVHLHTRKDALIHLALTTDGVRTTSTMIGHEGDETLESAPLCGVHASSPLIAGPICLRTKKDGQNPVGSAPHAGSLALGATAGGASLTPPSR